MIKVKTKISALKRIKLVTITNNTGLEVTLCSFAASVFDVRLNNKTLVYCPSSLKEFMFNGMFYGKTLGRTAGRIKNGEININGVTFHLKKWGNHTLHGAGGLSFKNFALRTKEDEESYQVEFVTSSQDGDKGYPGNVNVLVSYKIPKNRNDILIEFVAKSDKDTVLNLSNHTYWNLSSDIEKSCLNDLLKINASSYVDVDDELIFKEIKKVNEVMDFREEKEIGKDIYDEFIQKQARGYDYDFILDSSSACSLRHDNIVLNVETSYPVLHLYSANFFKKEHQYHGVALECQKLNHDTSSILLKKDEVYKEYILFKITGTN